jgi:DNA-binding Xre family transcriptional regulator
LTTKKIDMKLEKAIEILEKNQLWRTGEYDDYYYEPEAFHKAIDKVLYEMKKTLKLKNPSEIANQIKEIRLGRNYTQAWVAEQMGVTQGEYSKIENVKRKKFSIDTLNRISEILEVSVNDFIQ